MKKKKYKLEVIYDGTWVEDVIVEAESDSEAYEQVLDQAKLNIEVKHYKESEYV